MAEDLGPISRDYDYNAGLLQAQNGYDCLVNILLARSEILAETRTTVQTFS